ncbi:hypothetical protein C7999DRAFT_43482 [Corynascus novoguineensis]|uniref:Uncharacterized protein n=1 Tax=Corynascus novoguineensis TaxID=1126955 RepID=A0AAN7CMQ0_9PEZI|nr:hypothetical protein C7999DRAFT_43482 [Corynascus novoguineensis]
MASLTNRMVGGGEPSDSGGSRSPENQHTVPEFVIQTADNRDSDDGLSPTASLSPKLRAPPRLSDRAFLEVPGPPQPTNRQLTSEQPTSSQTSGETCCSRILKPLTCTFGLPPSVTSHVDPLRMHPVGLKGSSMLPITNSVGCPLDVMMEKVSNMLEASKALKPEPQSEPEPASTMAKSFFKKIRPPSSLFSKPNPQASVKPHQLRHITGDLGPLPLPEQTRHIPSIYLRRNELGNLKREKALRVLGDNPSFDPSLFAVIDSPGASQQAPTSFLSPPTSRTNEPLFSSPPRSTTTAATTTTSTGAASLRGGAEVGGGVGTGAAALLVVQVPLIVRRRMPVLVVAVSGGASFQSPAKGSLTTITALHSAAAAAATTEDGTSTVGVSTSTHAFRRQSRSIPDFDAGRDAGWDAGFGTVVVSAPGPALRAVLLGATAAEAATHREDGVSSKRHPTPAPGDLAALRRALHERYPGIARGGVSGEKVLEEDEDEEECGERERER